MSTLQEIAQQFERMVDIRANRPDWERLNGSEQPCFTERAALQLAVRRGVVLVAAAGHERRVGDPLGFPASFPHVITVGAVGDGDAPAPFSSTSRAVDVAAPDQDILNGGSRGPRPRRYARRSGIRSICPSPGEISLAQTRLGTSPGVEPMRLSRTAFRGLRRCQIS